MLGNFSVQYGIKIRKNGSLQQLIVVAFGVHQGKFYYQQAHSNLQLFIIIISFLHQLLHILYLLELMRNGCFTSDLSSLERKIKNKHYSWQP